MQVSWYAQRPDYVAAHDRPVAEVPVSHRRRAGSASACRPSWRSCRSSNRAYNPQALSVGEGGGHVAVRARHGPRRTNLKQNMCRTSAATCSPPPAPRSTTVAALLDMFGDWHLALTRTTGARATCSARSRATRRRVCPPTTRACACRRKRATTCRSCRRSKNIVTNPQMLRAHAAVHPEPPVLRDGDDLARYRRDDGREARRT